MMTPAADQTTLYLIPGFHFDPVWWNTQAHYVETGAHFPPEQGSAFQLLHAYLEACAKDPDYRFVVDQVPVLKPFVDSQPEAARELRRLIDQGRVEVVGASYNQHQSTLVGLEPQLRNLAYGILYQREISGREPTTAWQLDVFGHDPSFPQILASCGVSRVAFARGPFHQWSCATEHQNIPSEFYWLASDGSRVLTHFMPASYFYGWRELYDANTSEESVQALRRMSRILGTVAATSAVLVPMGADFARPLVDLGETARRHERQQEGEPNRCSVRIATPTEFFDSVTAENDPETCLSRDFGPIYTGVGVTYADLKIADRRTTNRILDAECWAAIASFLGEPWPAARLDHAWRRLLYGAHHDAITGTCSDQVYIDLTRGWRGAHDDAVEIDERARRSLARKIATAASPGTAPSDRALVVFNSMSFQRTDEVKVELPDDLCAAAAAHRILLTDADGREVPCEIEPFTHRRVFLRAVIPDLPPLGYRTLRLQQDATDGVVAGEEIVTRPTTIANEFYAVTVDPSRGGTISSLRDHRTGEELLQRGGTLANELIFHDEYSALPDHGEGPWHLCPTGSRERFREAAVKVWRTEGPSRQQIRVDGEHAGIRFRQTIELMHNLARIEFHTRIFDYTGANRLLRVHFPLARRGRRPICETATGMVGRPFSRPVDTANSAWTLEITAQRWVGLGGALIIALGGGARRAAGVAEMVLPSHAGAGAQDAAEVMTRALTRLGVTVTPTHDRDRRFGDLEHDSHGPDLRVILGGPESNLLTAKLITSLDEEEGRRWAALAGDSSGKPAWIETPGEVPNLILNTPPENRLAAITRRVARRLAVSRTLEASPVRIDPEQEDTTDSSVILLNRGTPCCSIDRGGEMALALFRSCPSWPAGHWVDPPARRHPDGSSYALQHWNHDFVYALTTTPADPIAAGAMRTAAAWNRPAAGIVEPLHEGTLPPAHSFVDVSGESAHVTAVKRAGFFGIDMLRGEPPNVQRLVLRLLETSGKRSRVSLRVNLPVECARRLDPLERDRGPIDREADRLSLPLAPHALETVGIDIAGPAPPLESVDPGPHPSRYWLVNSGAAPEGFMPFSVFVEPRRLTVTGSKTMTLQVLMTNARRQHPLKATLIVDGPLAGLEPIIQTRIELGAAESRRKRFKLPLPAATDSGALLMRVRLIDDDGLTVEDYARLDGNGDDRPPPLSIELPIRSVYITPGETVTLTARIANRSHLDLPVEIAAVTPVEAWGLVRPGQQRLRLAARQTVDVSFPIDWPVHDMAGELFALIRAQGAGTVAYSPAVRIAPAVERAIKLDRRPTRLRRFLPTEIEGEYVCRRPIPARSTVGLRVPNRFSSRVLHRTHEQGPDEIHRLRFCFEVTGPPRKTPERCPLQIVVRDPGRPPLRETLVPRVPPVLEAVALLAPLAADDLLDGIAGAEWATAQVKPPATGPGTRSEIDTLADISRDDLAETDSSSRATGPRGAPADRRSPRPPPSVRLQAAWDSRHLYVAAELISAVPFNDNEGAAIVKGDCLRLAFDPLGEDLSPGSQGDLLELAAALARGRAAWWAFTRPGGGRAGLIDGVLVAARRERGRTRLALGLDATALGLDRLRGGRRYGFNFAGAWRDQHAHRHVAEWSEGLAHGRDASLFGSILLVP